MNFAVIGLGSFGIKRATAIKNSKQANLVVISELDEKRAIKAKETLQVPVSDYNEILKNKKKNKEYIVRADKEYRILNFSFKKSSYNFSKKS